MRHEIGGHLEGSILILYNVRCDRHLLHAFIHQPKLCSVSLFAGKLPHMESFNKVSFFCFGENGISLTLQCWKQQNPFHDRRRKTRVDKMFNSTHPKLADVVDWLLGEIFYQIENRHCTNTLQLGEGKDIIWFTTLQLVSEDALLGLEEIQATSIPQIQINFGERQKLVLKNSMYKIHTLRVEISWKPETQKVQRSKKGLVHSQVTCNATNYWQT